MQVTFLKLLNFTIAMTLFFKNHSFHFGQSSYAHIFTEPLLSASRCTSVKVALSASHRCEHKDGITRSKGKQMWALKAKKFAEERGAKEGDGTALD